MGNNGVSGGFFGMMIGGYGAPVATVEARGIAVSYK